MTFTRIHRSSDPSIPLGDSTLTALAARVQVPTYDRRALSPAVVHIGVGGFHRAHQLVYFDDLAQRGISRDWGVIGVGMRSTSMRDALRPQDNLFTVVERGQSGERGRVVGVMGRYIFAPERPGELIEALSAPTTRLVTLTVTANGYPVDLVTGAFDPDEAILADLRHPRQPSSVFGSLVEALDRRRRHGVAPFTVLSCDNLQHNGAAARTAVVSFAALRDPQLAEWIGEHVSFPSSMVDRITPETTPQQRDAIAESLGVDDRWPVITEPFSQWIVEDDFCNGRPPLDEVGVHFVDDVQPYKLIKTRLLNAGHSAVGHLGYLCGYRTMHEAMADPVITEYVVRLLAEVSPMLPEIADLDVRTYRQDLLERFANPAISDRLSRLCGRGSTKIASYVLPSLRQATSEGRDCPMLMLALAGWLRYVRGVDESGREIDVQDVQKDRLQALAALGDNGPGHWDPRHLLQGHPLFHPLDTNQDFLITMTEILRTMDRHGTRHVLAATLAHRPEAVPA